MKIKKTKQTGKLKSDSEWIYGLHPVLEAVRAGRTIRIICISSSRHNKVSGIVHEAKKRKIPLKITGRQFFDYKFEKGHQGVAAEVSRKEYLSLDKLLDIPFEKREIPLFLILDCIEDPRNLGAILRVADAAGIHGIVMQSHRSVSFNSQVSKVSSGAVEYVPVSLVTNIKYAVSEMKKRGITIIGTEIDAEKTLWDIDSKVPLALIFGSEGKGLRDTVKKRCDMLIKIPMSGKINSLNVSVAAGIVFFEILRQRINKM